MFGFMKSCLPNQSCTGRTLYREQYCRVCKAIGKLYGHPFRFMLNYDTVFLSELLLYASGQDHLNRTEDKRHPFSCLKLPASVKDIPLIDQYTAAVNMLWVRLKLEDNLRDRYHVFTHLIDLCTRGRTEKAVHFLRRLEFPMETFHEWYDLHKGIEKTFTGDRIEEAIRTCSEPTAKMTGLVMAFGSGLAQNQDTAIYQILGEQFGRLIYVLDAYLDYRDDVVSGNFNPLIRTGHAEKGEMPDPVKKQAGALLIGLKTELLQTVEQLPFNPAIIDPLRERIELNFNRMLAEKHADRPVQKMFQVMKHQMDLLILLLRGDREKYPYYSLSTLNSCCDCCSCCSCFSCCNCCDGDC